MLLVNNYKIEPGATLVLNISGQYAALLSSDGVVDIDILQNHVQIGRALGVTQGFRFGPTAFNGVHIVNNDDKVRSIQVGIADVPVSQVNAGGPILSVDIVGQDLKPLMVADARLQYALDATAFIVSCVGAQLTNNPGYNPLLLHCAVDTVVDFWTAPLFANSVDYTADFFVIDVADYSPGKATGTPQGAKIASPHAGFPAPAGVTVDTKTFAALADMSASGTVNVLDEAWGSSAESATPIIVPAGHTIAFSPGAAEGANWRIVGHVL